MKQLDVYVSTMVDLYTALQQELLQIICKRLSNGSHDNILEWQKIKLQELDLVNKETIAIISKVTKISKPTLENIFKQAGLDFTKDVDSKLPYKSKPMPSNLDLVMQGYFNQMWLDFDNYVNQTLLSTNYHQSSVLKMYQDIINKTTAKVISGITTFDESLEQTIKNWALAGIKSSFIDKAGHEWSLESYTRTVLKSTLANAYNKVRTDRMSEYGVYTVLVTSHVGARTACAKIQGHVVDLRRPEEIPQGSKYKSIYDAYWHAEYGTAGGHRGCNCEHLHIPFVDGINENNQPKIDSELNNQVEKLRNKQRYLERAVVRAKKSKIIADTLGDTTKSQKYSQQIRGYQKKICELVDSNEYLYRDYKREKVYTPLDTLLKDVKSSLV